jgi:phage tail sheath protein FI
VNESQFIEVNLIGFDPSTGPPPANAQDVADKIRDAINTQLGAAVAGLSVSCKFDRVGAPAANLGVVRITSATEPRTSVTIRRATANDIAVAWMAGLDQGGIEVARYSNLRPVPNGTAFLGGTAIDDFALRIGDLAGVLQNAMTALAITGTAGENFGTSLQTTVPTDRFFVSPAGGFDGVREKLRIIANLINSDATLGWTAEVWGYHLALKPNTAGTINDIAPASLTGAPAALANAFVANTRQYALGTIGASPFQAAGAAGSDGVAPGVAEYLGDEATQTGFHALDSVDLFNLMVLPGDRDVSAATQLQLWGPASMYCQSRRAFLLMDAPDSFTVNGRPVAQAADVNALRSLVVKDYSAVFYPKVKFSDAGVIKGIGASGMIAGLMSRIDSTRGVWKAPAGIEADLRGITDVDVNLTDKENGVLNKLGVNCLRKFPAGFVNWGARTMDGSDDIGSEWKYIPIRRLALFLEESLFRGTKWVVFEPNDEPLWAKIRLNLNAFMMSLFRQGAFQGPTPDKAFFVKCDGETTTQNDRNLGIVNIEVGFAPLKPAEFVIIKIQQIAGDL